MIRSALRSVSYQVGDVVGLVKWAVGEAVAELDYRLQPEHVRLGWAAELADIEAEVEVHEEGAPYLQWGGPETWPQNTETGRVPCPVDDCPRSFSSYNSLNWHSAQEHLQQDPAKVGSGLEHWRFPGIDEAGDFKWHTFSTPAVAPYCNRCGYPHPTQQKCLRDESSAVPPTADENPGEVESGVSPHPETPSPGPDLAAYMRESDAVVAQFNEAEDRRLRLAMDVQAAVMEHCVLNPAHEPGDVTPDWIDVAYTLQRDYVITPRK